MTISAVVTYNLVRVTIAFRPSHHHLHHELLWQATMDNHWFHQLFTVGVDKYIITSPKFGQSTVQNLHTEFLLHWQKQPEGAVMLCHSQSMKASWSSWMPVTGCHEVLPNECLIADFDNNCHKNQEISIPHDPAKQEQG